ncbi:hypothetical protein BJX64DRAFT_285228 [Aspergillus heterothallicus]
MPRAGARAVELISLRQTHRPVARDEIQSMLRDLSRRKAQRRGRFSGWRGTIFLGCITSSIVLVLNVVMVCWAATYDSGYGRSVLYFGSCGRTKQISVGIHLLINVLSTALLGASNFGMQCLSAPTREDVDRAHANGRWVDIGIPSLRNLSQIPRPRVILWVSLVLSSLPLHLFYNSTVYATTSANAYDVYASNSTFTSLKPSDIPDIPDNGSDLFIGDVVIARGLVANSSSLEKLTPDDCLSTYAINFVTKYSNVVIISSDFNGSFTSLTPKGNLEITAPIEHLDAGYISSGKDYDPYAWICADIDEGFPCSSHVSEIRAAGNWSVYGYTVDYCLATREPEKCMLEYSLPLAIVVIVANVAKAVLLFFAARTLRDSPLLTTGDAVASFMQRADEASEGKCLLDHTLVRAGALDQIEQEPLKYNAAPKRRWSALSTARWILYLITYGISIIICISLLLYGLSAVGYFTPSDHTADGIWSLSLGAISPLTMITCAAALWPKTLIPATLLANTPQLIFTILYFMSNSILTAMALATEWSAFAQSRRGLRVSAAPRGAQRASHFLSLPYRYGLPLLASSALLHWLISQSIFLVNIHAYDARMLRAPLDDLMTLGWSPRAIVVGTVVGALLPAGLLVTSSRRFRSGMPVAGSCSLAIAAACHYSSKFAPKGLLPEEGGNEGVGMEAMGLMWGVEEGELISPEESDGGDGDGDGDERGEEGRHCGFTGGRVYPPSDGVVYR